MGSPRAMSKVRIYLTNFLPALQNIHRGSNFLKRRRDIRFAADMCLAHTANYGRAWTQSLYLRLLRRGRSSKPAALRHGRARSRRHLACTLVQRMRRFSLKTKRSEPSCGTDQRFESGHGSNGSVCTKLRTLQRLVPGGRHMEIDVLFEETADYIMGLQMQVHAMQTLADLYAKAALMDSNKFDPS
eukprot:Gb_14677 [translate_table: standard]